jgi:hypothetical protein
MNLWFALLVQFACETVADETQGLAFLEGEVLDDGSPGPFCRKSVVSLELHSPVRVAHVPLLHDLLSSLPFGCLQRTPNILELRIALICLPSCPAQNQRPGFCVAPPVFHYFNLSLSEEAHTKLDARYLGAPLAPLAEYSQNHLVSVIDLVRYKQ